MQKPYLCICASEHVPLSIMFSFESRDSIHLQHLAIVVDVVPRLAAYAFENKNSVIHTTYELRVP